MIVSQSVINICTRAAHEVNRVYCIAAGDDSQRPWDLAPEWAKESARKGVWGVLVLNNTPEESHKSWLEEKRATGWKYGPEKDESKKEHPCFVPFEELSPFQRMKDHLFVATVRAMYRAITEGQVEP